MFYSLIEPEGLNSMLYITKLMRQTRLWLESILQINLKSVGKYHLGLKRVLFFKKMYQYLYCAVLFHLLISSIQYLHQRVDLASKKQCRWPLQSQDWDHWMFIPSTQWVLVPNQEAGHCTGPEGPCDVLDAASLIQHRHHSVQLQGLTIGVDSVLLPRTLRVQSK